MVTYTARVLCFAFAALAAASGVARAGTETNYIPDGSFEQNSTTDNTSTFTGWTIGGNLGTSPGYGPEAFVTNGTTAGRYGDVVSADNAASPDPDSNFGGNYAVYFVDDAATQTLSQTIYLTAGTYEVGFDAFATASGYGNAGGATLAATIAGTTITNANVGSMPKATWEHFSANVTIGESAYYTFTFIYTSVSGAAKDVLVDDVYVISPSTLPGFGTYVPEPSSMLVLPVGLAMLGLLRRRTV